MRVIGRAQMGPARAHRGTLAEPSSLGGAAGPLAERASSDVWGHYWGASAAAPERMHASAFRDRVYAPGARNALELVLSAIDETESRAGNEILHGL